MKPSVRTLSRPKRIGLALAACALAGAANYFAPPLLLRHSLVLGPTVYWVALGLLGPRLALGVLLTNFLSLWAIWGEPFSSGLLMLESFWVGLAWRRSKNPVLADLLFWLTLGSAGGWFVFAKLLNLSSPSFEIALLLQPINGLTTVWFAYIANELLAVRKGDTLPGLPQNLARILVKRYLAFGTIPLLAAALLVAQAFEQETVRQSRNNLRQTALSTAEGLQRFLDQSVAVVEHSALRKTGASAMQTDRLNAELHQLHLEYPRFISLLAADASGHIVAAAPDDARERAQQSPIYVGDREYYRVPRATGRPYVSPVFRGRGFGQDLIVAASAPCLSEDGEWLGVIEASLTVATMKDVLDRSVPRAHRHVVLTDANHHVIEAEGYAEFHPLGKVPNARLQRQIVQAAGEPQNIVMEIDGRRQTMLSVTVPVSGYGWNLTLQRPMSEVLRPVIAAHVTTLVVGALTAIAAWLFVSWSIRDLLSALQRILDFSRGRPPAVLEKVDESNLPQELAELVRNLRELSSRADSERRQREELLARLESLVQERTRELEHALVLARSAEKAKDAFLATVSHELRTPLTSLVTGVRLLQLSGAASSPVAARTLETMERSSRVLMDVISDVLDFSKIQSGAMTLEPRPFSPVALIDDLQSIFRPRLEGKGIKFVVCCDYPRERLWCHDERRLRQILLNLLGNAVKFTAQGQVAVGTWIAEDRLHFSVSDSGPGIPPEQRASIFEPFVQLRSNREPSIAGTGLGLSISKRLTELMGGQISIEDVPGQGACFTFYIREAPPLEPEQGDTPPAPSAP